MILGRATYDCNMQCTTTNLNESNGKTPQKVHLTVIPGSEGVLEDNSTGGEKHTPHEHTNSGSAYLSLSQFSLQFCITPDQKVADQPVVHVQCICTEGEHQWHC